MDFPKILTYKSREFKYHERPQVSDLARKGYYILASIGILPIVPALSIPEEEFMISLCSALNKADYVRVARSIYDIPEYLNFRAVNIIFLWLGMTGNDDLIDILRERVTEPRNVVMIGAAYAGQLDYIKRNLKGRPSVRVQYSAREGGHRDVIDYFIECGGHPEILIEYSAKPRYTDWSGSNKV